MENKRRKKRGEMREVPCRPKVGEDESVRGGERREMRDERGEKCHVVLPPSDTPHQNTTNNVPSVEEGREEKERVLGC